MLHFQIASYFNTYCGPVIIIIKSRIIGQPALQDEFAALHLQGCDQEPVMTIMMISTKMMTAVKMTTMMVVKMTWKSSQLTTPSWSTSSGPY